MFREVYRDTLDSDPVKAKEQIFYYVYGLLHYKEYREKYQDTLSKNSPAYPSLRTSVNLKRLGGNLQPSM